MNGLRTILVGWLVLSATGVPLPMVHRHRCQIDPDSQAIGLAEHLKTFSHDHSPSVAFANSLHLHSGIGQIESASRAETPDLHLHLVWMLCCGRNADDGSWNPESVGEAQFSCLNRFADADQFAAESQFNLPDWYSNLVNLAVSSDGSSVFALSHSVEDAEPNNFLASFSGSNLVRTLWAVARC